MTIENADMHLEFLDKTSNFRVMRRCDDCNSDAIDLSSSPVPFGDFYHYVAHVSTLVNQVTVLQQVYEGYLSAVSLDLCECIDLNCYNSVPLQGCKDCTHNMHNLQLVLTTSLHDSLDNAGKKNIRWTLYSYMHH